MKPTTPLISVIVPCYNQAEYMDECLTSVLAQTYSNWECIIVNDGSPDNTEEIALQWTSKDPRFKYLKKENGGLSSARNAGIEIAKGEWILPLDSDDKIGDRYMELAEKEFENVNLVYANSTFFGTINNPWNIKYSSYKNLLLHNSIYCSAFFKKSDWQSIGGYDENLREGREDWEFYIRLLNENSKVKVLDYEGFFYRRKENSMDTDLNKTPLKIIEIDKYIFKKNIDKYLYYCTSFQKMYNEYEHLERQEKKLVKLTNEIRRNIFTRLLYRIITFFS